jgi:hypothetical protein
MFSDIVKNTVLVVLIVLILHFIILNRIRDMDVTAPPTATHPTATPAARWSGIPSATPTPSRLPWSANTPAHSSHSQKTIDGAIKTKPPTVQEKELQELMAYVYEETDLPKQYKQTMGDAGALENCYPGEVGKEKMLCKSRIDEHLDAAKKNKDTTVEDSVHPTPYGMPIAKYRDESVSNGGHWDGLVAYDGVGGIHASAYAY